MKPYDCFTISSEDEFNHFALETFRYQSTHVPIYKAYLEALNIVPYKVQHYLEIPFIPISFFKTHKVIAQERNAEIVFTSSGTTGMITSSHHVAEVELYEESFKKAFELFYGNIEEYCVIALLPAYMERTGSSLVYMTNELMNRSNQHNSGFYLNQYEELSKLLTDLHIRKQKTILIGVTFALLDLVEQFPIQFPELIVMETGGMKGRRKELVREDLHAILYKGFGVENIHSEYGMTELLSQAYSNGNGIFETPHWMKILIREINDPFVFSKNGFTGGVNVIDLANYFSCSFIATQDLGKLHSENQFEILGRFDNSDLRGCNLMVW